MRDQTNGAITCAVCALVMLIGGSMALLGSMAAARDGIHWVLWPIGMVAVCGFHAVGMGIEAWKCWSGYR